MVRENIMERLRVEESLVEQTGFNPYYLEINSGLEDKLLAKGQSFINLASNNYLGLAADERVKEAAIRSVEKYGVSLCGTPIATGYIDLYKKLEQELSSFIGLEDAIILPSCYQANNGLFLALARKEDLIIVDRNAHSSLIQGIKAVGCKIRPFLHNNLEHLAGILQRSHKYRQVFVVTESVFSTDGTIAPLKAIIDLCEEYQALPIVDDSHGLGVLGSGGRGILEEQQIPDFPGIYTASLGKALANAGGVVGGRKELIKYLKYYCPHLVYSTALPPAVLGGLEAVLDIIKTEFPLIKKRLYLYKQLINEALIEADFSVIPSKAPINSLNTGSKENTFLVAKRLYEEGILATPFIEPAVPIKQGRVRLIAGANLSQGTIEEAIAIIEGLGQQ